VIVITSPYGRKVEGIINDTSKPGTIMQIDTSVTTLTGGEWTYKAAAPGTDGLKIVCLVLMEDKGQGKTIDDAYVAGKKCEMWSPNPGDELNVRVGEVAGTGNSYTVNDRLIIDAEDGILVPFAATPQDTMFQAMETVTQVAGSSLLWCRKT